MRPQRKRSSLSRVRRALRSRRKRNLKHFKQQHSIIEEQFRKAVWLHWGRKAVSGGPRRAPAPTRRGNAVAMGRNAVAMGKEVQGLRGYRTPSGRLGVVISGWARFCFVSWEQLSLKHTENKPPVLKFRDGNVCFFTRVGDEENGKWASSNGSKKWSNPSTALIQMNCFPFITISNQPSLFYPFFINILTGIRS